MSELHSSFVTIRSFFTCPYSFGALTFSVYSKPNWVNSKICLASWEGSSYLSSCSSVLLPSFLPSHIPLSSPFPQSHSPRRPSPSVHRSIPLPGGPVPFSPTDCISAVALRLCSAMAHCAVPTMRPFATTWADVRSQPPRATCCRSSLPFVAWLRRAPSATESNLVAGMGSFTMPLCSAVVGFRVHG